MAVISVCILSHNRPEDLHWVIESVFAQDYPPQEILVVDNGSNSGLLKSLRRLYPSVEIIALSENIGVGARALGIERAAGDLIVTLDDDVAFADSTALRTLVEEFERNPSTTCLTFNILNPKCFSQSRSDWGHPKSFSTSADKEFVTPWFAEGACAFRKKIFSRIESYWPVLHFGMEGPELALRLLDIQAEIRYVPTVRVIHRRSESGRTLERTYFHHTRSLILVAYRNLPAHAAPKFLIPRLLMLLVLACKAGSTSIWIKGIIAGFLDCYHHRNERNPVSAHTWMQYLYLRREMPSIPKRIIRYLVNYSGTFEINSAPIEDQKVVF